MRINKKNSLLVVSFLTTFISVSGCTTCANAVPNDEPTMAEIYEQAMQQSCCSTLEQARGKVKNIQFDRQKSNYQLTETNGINTLFPTLPNPQLVMYIYPHLSQPDEAPVPGYTTAFRLYERDCYAADGEAKF